MSQNNNHPLGKAPWLHVIISTGLGTGFVPVCPGTAGAFMALVIWYVMYLFMPVWLLFWCTLGLIIAVTFIGVWTSNVMEQYWGPDPRTVVIDEYVGAWMPLLVAAVPQHAGMTAILGLFGFVMFRLIDIFKPLGCRAVERNVPGGWGVMLDDVLAGFYALLLTLLLRWLIL